MDFVIPPRDFEVDQHISECRQPTGAFEQVDRLQRWHMEFDRSDAVHFLADDLLRLPQRPIPQRQIRVRPRHELPNQTGPQHQLM